MSAYALETVLFIERKAYLLALGYAAGTVTVSVAAVFAGLLLARKAFGP